MIIDSYCEFHTSRRDGKDIAKCSFAAVYIHVNVRLYVHIGIYAVRQGIHVELHLETAVVSCGTVLSAG